MRTKSLQETDKIFLKCLTEALKDYNRPEKYSYDETSEDADLSFLEDDEEPTPYFIKKILWKAIDKAIIDIWDEEDTDFTIYDVKKWLQDAVDEYPIEQLSIFSYLTKDDKE